MPKASDLSPEKRFFGLFVGPSGSGKTCAECSFPTPIDILDFDGRIRGILGAPWLDDKRNDIRYEYYPPRQPNIAKLVDDKLEMYNSLYKAGQPLPQTLILDSLTTQTFAMLLQAIPLTHMGNSGGEKGKFIGSLAMAGPEDYGFEAMATYNIISFLKTVPIPNVIVSAHIVQKYGKADPSNKYSESVPIGEKLSVRDKIAENVLVSFDHVFRFDRREEGNRIEFFVKFWSDLARTSYTGMPTGEVNITGKNFYEVMMDWAMRGQKSLITK